MPQFLLCSSCSAVPALPPGTGLRPEPGTVTPGQEGPGPCREQLQDSAQLGEAGQVLANCKCVRLVQGADRNSSKAAAQPPALQQGVLLIGFGFFVKLKENNCI